MMLVYDLMTIQFFLPKVKKENTRKGNINCRIKCTNVSLREHKETKVMVTSKILSF
jgi:hypothetical protein